MLINRTTVLLYNQSNPLFWLSLWIHSQCSSFRDAWDVINRTSTCVMIPTSERYVAAGFCIQLYKCVQQCCHMRRNWIELCVGTFCAVTSCCKLRPPWSAENASPITSRYEGTEPHTRSICQRLLVYYHCCCRLIVKSIDWQECMQQFLESAYPHNWIYNTRTIQNVLNTLVQRPTSIIVSSPWYQVSYRGMEIACRLQPTCRCWSVITYCASCSFRPDSSKQQLWISWHVLNVVVQVCIWLLNFWVMHGWSMSLKCDSWSIDKRQLMGLVYFWKLIHSQH